MAPSIIAGDFGRLAECAAAVEKAGADWLHMDVMDGHFVPNLTFGPDVVAAARAVTHLPLDTHLMISEPHRYLERFAKAGADPISVHIEACPQPEPMLASIRKEKVRAGLALNPHTRFSAVEKFLPHIDLLVVMSVQPGFTGQSFMPMVLEKVQQAALWRQAHGGDWLIEVDGGIHAGNVKSVWDAGADVVVAGASVLRTHDYAAAIGALREA